MTKNGIDKIFEDVNEIIKSEINSDALGEIVINNKTVNEWDEYFNIEIKSSEDLTLEEVRDKLVLINNRLDVLRNLINKLNRQVAEPSSYYDTVVKKYVNDKIEYTNGRAKNITMSEREATYKFLSLKVSIKYLETILENFKTSYRVLVNKIEIIKLIQFSLSNEIKYLR